MKKVRSTLTLIASLSIGLSSAAAVHAQASGEEMEPDYARAAEFSSFALMGKVLNGSPVPHWIGSEDRFWLQVQTAPGVHEFVIVDAATARQTPAFDHEAVAHELHGIRALDLDEVLHPDGGPDHGARKQEDDQRGDGADPEVSERHGFSS